MRRRGTLRSTTLVGPAQGIEIYFPGPLVSGPSLCLVPGVLLGRDDREVQDRKSMRVPSIKSLFFTCSVIYTKNSSTRQYRSMFYSVWIIKTTESLGTGTQKVLVDGEKEPLVGEGWGLRDHPGW